MLKLIILPRLSLPVGVSRFDELQMLITSNGGLITENIQAEKLTHIVQGGGGGGRYRELRKISSR